MVAHTVALRTEVTDVDVSDADNERNKFRHFDTVLDELPTLLWIIGQQSNGRNSEIFQDRGSHTVVTCVCREAECEVGVQRVEAILLEPVGLQFVGEPNPTSFMSS